VTRALIGRVVLAGWPRIYKYLVIECGSLRLDFEAYEHSISRRELSGGTNVDDLERPRTWKIWVLSEFFAILACDAHLVWIFAEIYWK